MKGTQDNPLYWKDRYQKLLKESEYLRQDLDENHQYFSRAIIRLAQATHGLDSALDPHLTLIRDLLRRNAQVFTHALEKELDAAIEALLRVQRSDFFGAAQKPGFELLRFLEYKHPSPEYLPALRDLRQKIEAGELSSERSLYALAASLKPADDESGDQMVNMDDRMLRLRLGEILKALNVPAAIAERRRMIIVGLVKGTEKIMSLFHMTAELITELGSYEKIEQKKLLNFLGELTDKLVSLEEKVLGSNSLAESSAQEQLNSNQAVSHQVADLMTEASASTDMNQLKELISNKLEGIYSQLSSSQNLGKSTLIQIQRQNQELVHRLKELEQESDDLRAKLSFANEHEYVDIVTNLPNKAAYQDRFNLEEKRWKRFKQPLSLALFDIDHFKLINERYGQPAGDKILTTIGRIFTDGIRDTDFISRFGGDEFALLLIGADDFFAHEVVETIRKRIESFEFVSGGKPVSITASCGISQFKGNDTKKDVFKRAAAALREAKQSGRNRSLSFQNGL